MIKNKENFIKFCKQTIHRDGIDDLLEWLDQTDFFTAPASSKFHGNYAGGLCEHSLNVAKTLKGLCEAQDIGCISEESIAITALFHDICKVNFYKKGVRNVKNPNGNWIQKEVWEIDEQTPYGDHADKSIIILQQYIKLTPEEIYAIRSHMGGFDSSVKGGSYMISKIFERSNLSVLLHCADLISCYLLETQKTN